MKKGKYIILGLLVMGFIAVTTAQPVVYKEELTDCEVLVVKKCDDCHYMTRICDQLGKKSLRRWKSTIKRMVKHGAKASKTEQKELAQCLYEMPVGAKIVCE